MPTASVPSTDALREPLLGEWACLGVLYGAPAHGWAVAKRLQPGGDIGRIWHLSRPLTYRALDQLTARGWIAAVGEEPGDAGPNRTILGITRTGRARFRQWVGTPVPHLRDLRSAFLLKLVFAAEHGVDVTRLLARQRSIIDEQASALAAASGPPASGAGARRRARDVDPRDVDVVALWRIEATSAAQRFLDRVSSIS